MAFKATDNWRCGTSGLVLPVPNKLSYPEELKEKSRLYYYSTLFNSLEVNSSFYKLPMRRTVERWSQDVSEHFDFTFKLSKEITHCRELAFEKEAVHRFFEVITVPERRRGCLLIQFPGKISFDHFDRLQALLKSIKSCTRRHQWKIAIEFRHETWYNDTTRKLLSAHHAACVIHDIKPFTKDHFDTDTEVIYIRFHGTEKNYRGSYTDTYLEGYATEIRRWLRNGKQVYVYFNNTLGPAVQNLQTLDRYVRR